MLPLVRAQGGDVIGVDWRIELDRAWEAVGHEVAIQGNLDPVVLLGPRTGIEERVADILRRAAGRPGHVFNLGHGILPQTPPDNVRFLVDAVHRLSPRVTG
jgi:uroporphyrinogen decarboxylase